MVFKNRIFMILLWCLLEIHLHVAEICYSEICEFKLVVRKSRNMLYTAKDGNVYNIKMNATERRLQIVENSFRKKNNYDIIGQYVDADDVITADGFSRNIITINGKFPGPTLEVMENSQVAITVVNQLYTEGITLHWHGLHLTNNLWMDGTAYVTQCPILPMQSFAYRFIADPVGTHWYHSHISSQRLDGLYGAIIVHKQTPVLPYYIMTLHDWTHHDAQTLEVMSPFNMIQAGSGEQMYHNYERYFSVDGAQYPANRYINTLINGRGRLDYSNDILPLTKYDVTSGQRYIFRVLHVGSDYFYELSVDNHTLVVTASDGHNIKPVTVNTIFIGPGETIDFEVIADQPIGQYWIRADIERISEVDNSTSLVGGRAILSYSSSSSDPSSRRLQCTLNKKCIVFNCAVKGFALNSYRKCITMDDIQSQYSNKYLQDLYGINDKEQDIQEIFLNVGFHWGTSINARKFISPSAPLFENIDSKITPCDKIVCKTGCLCTNLIDLPYNKTIQIIISNMEVARHVNHHTVHLHGHTFAVMKMGFPSYNVTTGKWLKFNDDVICDSDQFCAEPFWTNSSSPTLNANQPPIKDTVSIPARGYTVIRFKTLNPGIWLFHCHQESHQREGMALLFNEAPSLHPKLPKKFMNCDDFNWNSGDFTQYIADSNNRDDKKKSPDTRIISEENNKTVADKDRDVNTIQVKLNVLIVGIIGFTIFGATLVTIPLKLFHRQKNKEFQISS